MSDLIQAPSEFQVAVDDYLKKEKRVGDTFIHGVISLGKELETARNYWKPLNKWTDFCTAVGKSLAGANQFIRVYQCSKIDPKLLSEANITNWHKINLFLQLPEKARQALAKSIGGLSQTDEEWDNQLDKIAPNKAPRIRAAMAEEDMLHLLSHSTRRHDDRSKSVNTEDATVLGKNIIGLLKKRSPVFSDKSVNFSKALAHMFSSWYNLDDVAKDKITAEEKVLWIKMLSDTATILAKRISKL